MNATGMTVYGHAFPHCIEHGAGMSLVGAVIAVIGIFHGFAHSADTLSGERLAQRAEQLGAAMREAGWTYATNPKREKKQTNCVIFLADLLEMFYELSPQEKRRVLVNESIGPDEQLETLVLSHDQRIRGVQSALSDLAGIGTAIPRSKASRGDLVQYWYWSSTTGALAGHAGVITQVLRNTDSVFEFELAGAHRSVDGPGIIQISLTGKNLGYVFLVSVDPQPE